MNPMGMTPVIIDEEGPGDEKITIPQSIGIMFYLAEKVGKFIPTAPAERAAFWNPMMNATTDIGRYQWLHSSWGSKTRHVLLEPWE